MDKYNFISLNPEVNKAIAKAKQRKRRREWWENNDETIFGIIKVILLAVIIIAFALMNYGGER